MSRDRSRRARQAGQEGREPSAFLPLPTATFHILLALRSGEKHGYAVMQNVEDLSDGLVKLGPGTLYGAVKRLLADGLIEESEQRPDPELDDQRRRYYRLTALGERVCTAELERLTKLLKTAFPSSVVSRLGHA
jgi:DNA-binding PadR family transcriptional regulator